MMHILWIMIVIKSFCEVTKLLKMDQIIIGIFSFDAVKFNLKRFRHWLFLFYADCLPTGNICFYQTIKMQNEVDQLSMFQITNTFFSISNSLILIDGCKQSSIHLLPETIFAFTFFGKELKELVLLYIFN